MLGTLEHSAQADGQSLTSLLREGSWNEAGMEIGFDEADPEEWTKVEKAN